jgi:hypothetical protein
MVIDTERVNGLELGSNLYVDRSKSAEEISENVYENTVIISGLIYNILMLFPLCLEVYSIRNLISDFTGL